MDHSISEIVNNNLAKSPAKDVGEKGISDTRNFKRTVVRKRTEEWRDVVEFKKRYSPRKQSPPDGVSTPRLIRLVPATPLSRNHPVRNPQEPSTSMRGNPGDPTRQTGPSNAHSSTSGACRHGDKCSRIHNRPAFSQTVLLRNLYQNPQFDSKCPDLKPNAKKMSDAEAQRHFDDLFEEIFIEAEDEYGEIEEINICDNISEHLIGNTYIKFRSEESAAKAVEELQNRWFNGSPIYAELSPVTDFREACCRQYEMGECTRGGFCNFMHLKPISRELRKELYLRDHPWRHRRKKRRSSSERSRSPTRSKSKTASPGYNQFSRRNDSPVVVQRKRRKKIK